MSKTKSYTASMLAIGWCVFAMATQQPKPGRAAVFYGGMSLVIVANVAAIIYTRNTFRAVQEAMRAHRERTRT